MIEFPCDAVMMMDEVAVVAVSTLMLGCAADVLEKETTKKRKKRTVWVKPWLAVRSTMGAYQALVVDFANNIVNAYKHSMSPREFTPPLFAQLFVSFSLFLPV